LAAARQAWKSSFHTNCFLCSWIREFFQMF